MKTVKRIFAMIMTVVFPITAFAGVPACISKHYPDKTLVENAIQIMAPAIAENGAVVGIGIEKIANLPQDTYVKEVSFFNEFRDGPVARFEFSDQVKSNSLKTRVRLRQSSNLYAVAKLSDGQLLIGKTFIKVTIGGCGGGDGGDAISKEKKICAD